MKIGVKLGLVALGVATAAVVAKIVSDSKALKELEFSSDSLCDDDCEACGMKNVCGMKENTEGNPYTDDGTCTKDCTCNVCNCDNSCACTETCANVQKPDEGVEIKINDGDVEETVGNAENTVMEEPLSSQRPTT